MDIEILRYTAAKTGLGLNYISKDEKVSYLLSRLWEVFGEDVTLKGGTALNRVHLSKRGVSRFSEDIDLDHIAEGSIQRKMDDIKKGMADMEDMEVEGPRMLHRTARFDCRYTNELGQKDRVMVEFYLSMPPYLERSSILVKSPFSDAHPTIFSVYSMEDILAKKIIALCRRMEGKDLYDVFHALHNGYDKEKLREALRLNMDFYGLQGDLSSNIKEAMENVKNNITYIGNSTNHFIPRSLRPNWDELVNTLEADLGDI